MANWRPLFQVPLVLGWCAKKSEGNELREDEIAPLIDHKNKSIVIALVVSKNDPFAVSLCDDIKEILKKLYNFGCRNLLIEGGNDLTNFLIKNKIFNKFYLFKSPKNLSKSLEYLKFSGLKKLKQKYPKKINLNLNLRKDRITLYR